MGSSMTHKYVVACIEDENLRFSESGIITDTIKICPLLHFVKDQEGAAVDGQLKTEDTTLASSIGQGKGISVSYKLKLKVSVGGMMESDIQVELPFDLCNFAANNAPKALTR